METDKQNTLNDGDICLYSRLERLRFGVVGPETCDELLTKRTRFTLTLSVRALPLNPTL